MGMHLRLILDRPHLCLLGDLRPSRLNSQIIPVHSWLQTHILPPLRVVGFHHTPLPIPATLLLEFRQRLSITHTSLILPHRVTQHLDFSHPLASGSTLRHPNRLCLPITRTLTDPVTVRLTRLYKYHHQHLNQFRPTPVGRASHQYRHTRLPRISPRRSLLHRSRPRSPLTLYLNQDIHSHNPLIRRRRNRDILSRHSHNFHCTNRRIPPNPKVVIQLTGILRPVQDQDPGRSSLGKIHWRNHGILP